MGLFVSYGSVRFGAVSSGSDLLRYAEFGPVEIPVSLLVVSSRLVPVVCVRHLKRNYSACGAGLAVPVSCELGIRVPIRFFMGRVVSEYRSEVAPGPTPFLSLVIGTCGTCCWLVAAACCIRHEALP